MATIVELLGNGGRFWCLKERPSRLDHATPGAHALLKKYKKEGMAATLAAQGHHDSLQIGRLRELLEEALKMKEPISPKWEKTLPGKSSYHPYLNFK